MDRYFEKILNQPIVINLKILNEINKYIESRNVSTHVDLYNFIETFSDIITYHNEVESEYYELAPHQKESLAEDLEVAKTKLALALSVLIKYFYPIIEQLEKIVDDSIMLESEFDKRQKS